MLRLRGGGCALGRAAGGGGEGCGGILGSTGRERAPVQLGRKGGGEDEAAAGAAAPPQTEPAAVIVELTGPVGEPPERATAGGAVAVSAADVADEVAASCSEDEREEVRGKVGEVVRKEKKK